NVARLQPAWIYQIDSSHRVQTSPLVVDGIMYATEPPGTVLAIDTSTGRRLWSYHHTVPSDLRLCCGQPNRGLAILGNAVFYATVDAHLISLDTASGRKLWEITMADYKRGYSSTAAPLAVKDKIVTGIAGGEFGVRGFLDAYDAKTGNRVWRFW